MLRSLVSSVSGRNAALGVVGRAVFFPALSSLSAAAPFSSQSATAAATAVKIPPNLSIDPLSSFAPQPLQRQQKSKSTSFSSRNKQKKSLRIDPVSSQQPQEDDEKQIVKPLEEDDADDEADYYDDVDEEEEEDDELFLPTPEILYAKPLPDRLHVDIQSLNARDGSAVGTIWLNASVFGHDDIRVDLMKKAVLYYRNKARGRRKAQSKTLATISGSGRKLRPQKGQGKARVGHSRPSHFRGGARAHGQKNATDYGKTKLNKKVRKLALRHALSQRLKEGNLILLDQLYQMPSHKTREVGKIFTDWGWGGLTDGASALILDAYYDDQNDDAASSSSNKKIVASHKGVPVPFYLAVSNIPRITTGCHHDASVYQILRHDKLVLTLAALEQLESRLQV